MSKAFVPPTDEDASTAALPGATPLEEVTFGPPNREITIDGRTIPAADIASLDVIAHRFRVSLDFEEPPGATTPEVWVYEIEASGAEAALRNTIRLPGTNATFHKLAQPTPTQTRALQLAEHTPIPT